MSLLLNPLDASRIYLKNRLIMPPMATSKSHKNGKVTQELLDYYDEKSKGGYLSLVIIEHSFIAPEGKASIGQLSIAEDSLIGSLSELADIIHKNGTKAIMQINHAGIAAKKEITGLDNVGPSSIPFPDTNHTPRMLTTDEISKITEQFGAAALRVKKAGFDGVEIHACHGYLLSQFFSPLTNQRTDEYGKDVYGRIKLHLDVIRAVRETVGNNYPILLRFGASDYMEGGVTIDDAKIAAAEFEKAGIDILDISGGLCRYTVPFLPKQSFFAPLSYAVKQVIKIPVILTGGIWDVKIAEQLLRDKKADLIGIGRALLKDSLWAKHAVEDMQKSN
jgi:2,4-dienoyl-CoA reductase-like NADH-dependent reductase (Old Yellow Enzyme family)